MSIIRIQVSQFDKPFAITGRFFKLVSASDSVNVRFIYHDDSELETVLYQGLSIEHPKDFKSFFISAETHQEVVLFASQAKLVDDRLETSITGAATLDSSTAELFANVLGEIVPARLGRRSALIVADEVVYIGGSNLDMTNGIKVDAGESIEIESQAAIYGLSISDQMIRILEEVN
ncbi:hypothetical protein ACODM8_14410 [Vibrio ostreicida]|uniref:hypothetical protein n=1 Tax=Vibrio ostreicida TaxID=526588 RepID=UPI003B5BE273